jgi:hypothetical protein
MNRTFGAAALLALAFAMPAQDAQAQDPLGGALLGGAAGAILGGVVGGGRGAAVGAGIGAATGAIIGSQGQARAGGYYWYQGGCYIQRGDGAWVQVSQRYCDPGMPPPAPVYAPAPAYGPPPAEDAVAWCMQRYRSYDPRSGTFVGYDGIRRPCP